MTYVNKLVVSAMGFMPSGCSWVDSLGACGLYDLTLTLGFLLLLTH